MKVIRDKTRRVLRIEYDEKDWELGGGGIEEEGRYLGIDYGE